MRGGRYSVRYVVEPLHDRLYGPATPALRLIFVAATLLFLIACANVANLALARALERRREQRRAGFKSGVATDEIVNDRALGLESKRCNPYFLVASRNTSHQKWLCGGDSAA